MRYYAQEWQEPNFQSMQSFFSHPGHLECHFTWLTSVSNMKATIEQNMKTQIGKNICMYVTVYGHLKGLWRKFLSMRKIVWSLTKR